MKEESKKIVNADKNKLEEKAEIFNRKIKDKIKEFFVKEDGMGVVEIVLIILVLVGLALIFKNQITAIAGGIYDSIKAQVAEF